MDLMAKLRVKKLKKMRKPFEGEEADLVEVSKKHMHHLTIKHHAFESALSVLA